MNKEKELINISYFDNQELSIKEHCDTYRKIVNEITNILRKYDIKFVLGETEICKDLRHQLEEKEEYINIMNEAFDELKMQKQDYTQINILEMKLEEKDKVIKKAIEFIKDEGLYEEDFKIFNDDINFNELSKLLKILERNKE